MRCNMLLLLAFACTVAHCVIDDADADVDLNYASPGTSTTRQPPWPTAQPVRQPSLHPTRQPSLRPSTRSPSLMPSTHPTAPTFDTIEPTRRPTKFPTRAPTEATPEPSPQPTNRPTLNPAATLIAEQANTAARGQAEARNADTSHVNANGSHAEATRSNGLLYGMLVLVAMVCFTAVCIAMVSKRCVVRKYVDLRAFDESDVEQDECDECEEGDTYTESANTLKIKHETL